MSLVTRVIRVAGLLFVMFGERKPLNMVVHGEPQIVRDQLADAGGHVLFKIAAHRADDGNYRHAGNGEIQMARLLFPNR